LRHNALLGLLRGVRDRSNYDTRPYCQQSFDDDALAGTQAFLNDPVVADAFARLYRTRFNLVAWTYRVHRLDALVLLDCALWNYDHALSLSDLKPDAAELPRQHDIPRIRKPGLYFQRSGARVHLIQHVLNPARIRQLYCCRQGTTPAAAPHLSRCS